VCLRYLITALAVHAWDNRTVLTACAGLIVAAAVLNLCVPDVYRINRLPGDDQGARKSSIPLADAGHDEVREGREGQVAG